MASSNETRIDLPALHEAGIPQELLDRYEEIVGGLHLQVGDREREVLDRAFVFAYEAHQGQARVSGEPYIVHPLEVMGILAELNVDSVTLIGALLHDIVEDTGFEVGDVARSFGPVVALLVEGMTKLKALRYDAQSNEERQAEYFRKMLLSMAHDLRVILIKLADRLHNMRTLGALPTKTRQRIAKETLEIYSPLAHRFGIGRIKWELEDLSLKIIDEVAYRRIAERVSVRREVREEQIDAIVAPLTEKLASEGIDARISGRAKHFYSIYNKIKKRGKSFEEILDPLAVRVIVTSVSDCYKALGVVHSLYTPILERFGDYIAMPKANMYRSLHTKVMDRKGNVVEVQIRTEEMDLVAEAGIAAHWQYKEGHRTHDNKGGDDELFEYYGWLRQLIEGSKEDVSGAEFMETLKINLFTDEVFVFTPKGKLIQLPKGSTPIDFAFAVHTDVGLRALGAKVNGAMVSLHHQLANGDAVEVLTSNTVKPSFDWLKYVKTHRARNKIRKYFKQAHFEESVALGEDMLKRELGSLRKKLSNRDLEDLANQLGFETIESLHVAIGVGDLSATHVVNRLTSEQQEAKDSKPGKSGAAFLRGAASTKGMGVRVKGADNLMINFGNCCNPLPGDRIVGFISKGRGIVVHRSDCMNISDLTRDQERLVPVEWDARPDHRFNARLRLITEDRPNMLRDLAEVLAKLDVHVIEMNLRTEAALGVGTLVVNVKNLAHMSKLRNKINKVKGVVRVERVGVAEVTD